MSKEDNDFHVRPGRIRSGRSPQAKGFINQVLRAACKAGPSPGKVGGSQFSFLIFHTQRKDLTDGAPILRQGFPSGASTTLPRRDFRAGIPKAKSR
ncbi:hypothetical protein [Rhodospirillum rubrum]|uniref:hypothetical protein n=1 Tax=Rhodospirillum rubrum TaxID=1085 RepID=UPI0019059120|nr:hypothetical protein [Rhodospirillum rubrum]